MIQSIKPFTVTVKFASVFRLAKKIPAIRRKVDEELGTISKSFEEDITNKTGKLQYLKQLPSKGLSSNEILNTLRINLALGEEGWKTGYASGAVYVHDENLQALTADAFKLSSYTNPLHPDLFPGKIMILKFKFAVLWVVISL